jgi:hypothetical protein
MKNLKPQGRIDARLDIIVVEVVSHQHENGTDTFPSERENVADGGIEFLRLAFEWQVGDGFIYHLQESFAAIHYYILYIKEKPLSLTLPQRGGIFRLGLCVFLPFGRVRKRY